MAAICIACTRLPDRGSDQATLEAITQLARALGTDEPAFTAWDRRPPGLW